MATAAAPADDAHSRPDDEGEERPDWMPPGGFSNPYLPGTWLYDLFGEVVRENKDLLMLVDDHDADRGSGKTITSLQLAAGMDQTDEGLTKDKVFIEVEPLLNAYHELPEGSALVLDEAEISAGHRDTQSKTNRALSEIIATGRVEQKYLVANLPAIDFIDLNVRKMTKVWIMMVRRGLGLVHHLRREPYSGTLLKEKKQWIEVEDVAADNAIRDVYNYLTREKRKHIRGERGEAFIPKSEHQEEMRKLRTEMEKSVRNENLTSVYRTFEDTENHLSYEQVGRAFGVSGSSAHRIVNDDGE